MRQFILIPKVICSNIFTAFMVILSEVKRILGFYG